MDYTQIPLWVSGTTYRLDEPVYWLISGIGYIFVALADGTTSQPSFANADWQLIGKDLLFNSTYTY